MKQIVLPHKITPPLKDLFMPTHVTSLATNTGVSIVVDQKKMGNISHFIPALRTWHPIKKVMAIKHSLGYEWT